MNHMLSQHTFWKENRNVSFSDSVCLDVYAVILLILESPWAQRETTIATVNRFTVRMTPCLVCEQFNCYGLGMGRECGSSPGITHLVAWRQAVYTPVLEMVSVRCRGGGLR